MLKGAINGSDTSGVVVTISANAANVNLYTLAGSPSVATRVTFVIASGVIVSDAARSGYALRTAASTGSWPAGSVLTLVNNGYVEGCGGGGNSGTGGHAIALLDDLIIDNTNGYIRGGGGGGGAGGSDGSGGNGGSGGGGQGNAGGPRGGTDSTAGTRSAPGTGGAGFQGSFDFHGGTGGAGGAWGQPGGSGGESWHFFAAGAAGGAAGKAISLNGKAVTWLGGFNSTQVRGAVA